MPPVCVFDISNCFNFLFSQLLVGVREFLTNWTMQQGPAFPTSKYACDLKMVRLLRQRGLGNSSSAVMKQVREQHGESYLNNLQMHLSHYRDFKTSAERGFFARIQFSEPPPAAAVPRHRWLMKVYQIDVLNRVDYIKAHMTSQCGTVLKMDSIKKITNKLAGRFFEKKIYVNELYIVAGKVKYFFTLMHLKEVNEILTTCIM